MPKSCPSTQGRSSLQPSRSSILFKKKTWTIWKRKAKAALPGLLGRSIRRSLTTVTLKKGMKSNGFGQYGKKQGGKKDKRRDSGLDSYSESDEAVLEGSPDFKKRNDA